MATSKSQVKPAAKFSTSTAIYEMGSAPGYEERLAEYGRAHGYV